MNYTTQKCLERVGEDTIAHTTKGTIISIDKDEQGLFIESKDEDGQSLISRLKDDKFVFYKNGQKVNTCDAEHLIGMSKAILRLVEGENLTTEDGTVADLGPVPTGHKKELYHSLDMDENDLDDGR